MQITRSFQKNLFYPRTVPLRSKIFTRYFGQLNTDLVFKDDTPLLLPNNGNFETHNCPPPPTVSSVKPSEILKFYKEMLVIRRMEQAADLMYKSRLVRGFLHLSIGQEAVAVGLKAGSDLSDPVITSYRCHSIAHIKGLSVHSILSELAGKSAGCSKGKGGSMHLYGEAFYGGNGIVGAQVPLGIGIAFTQKYLKTSKVTFVMYGDGAANQGQVFEAFNMAKLWNLPVVFCCENNVYGMGTSITRSSASTNYYKRGDYIPGIRVNGMDVLSVREAVGYSKGWVLSGKGPIILEFDTYRYHGHSLSDPGTSYRTKDEVTKIKQSRDCITGCTKHILENSIMTEEGLKAIDKDIQKSMDDVVEMIESEENPGTDQLMRDIYVPGSEPDTIRGLTVFDI